MTRSLFPLFTYPPTLVVSKDNFLRSAVSVKLNRVTNLQHRDAGAGGGGQSLMSPGSCLEEFRARPFIECRGLGTCNYFSTATSYWLATIKENEMFRRPTQQTLKTDHTSRVSRCTVCLRRRIVESPPALSPFILNGQKYTASNIQYAPQPHYPEYLRQRQGPLREQPPRRRVPNHLRRHGRVHKQERAKMVPATA